ncbi:MAG: PAS domain S-box protein [Clostridia bacterium]
MKKFLLPMYIVILALLYTSSMFLDIPFLKDLLIPVSTVVVGLAALSHGLLAGIPLGLVAGLANVYVLTLVQGASFDLLSPVLPAGLFPLLAGLVFGLAGRMMQKKQALLAKNLATAGKAQELSDKKIAEYEQVMSKMTTEPLYKKGEEAPVMCRPDLERVLGIIANKSLSGPDAGEGMGGQALGEKCFCLLADAMPGALAVMDLEGNILCYNMPLMAFLGYTSKADIIGKNITEFVQDNNREDLTENIRSVLIPGLNKGEIYRFSTRDGWSLAEFPPPAFRLTVTGNPRSLLAILVDEHLTGAFPPKEEWHARNVWVLSPEGNTLYVSNALAGILGYTAAGMQNMPVFHFMDESNASVFRQVSSSPRDNIETKHCMELQAKSGERLDIFAEIFPASNAAGEPMGTVVFVEDITQRRLIEKSLQHHLVVERIITDISAKFLRTEHDKIEDAIKEILGVLVDFLGVPEGQVQIFESLKTGEAFSCKWVRPEGIPRDPLQEETLSIPILDGSDPSGCFRFVQNGESRAWLEEDFTLLKISGEVFLHAMMRRQALMKLRLGDEKMRITLHSMGDAVLVTDISGKVALLNDEAEKLTGWTRQDAIGKPVDGIFMLVKGDPSEPLKTNGQLGPEEYSLAVFDRKVLVLRSRYGTERYISARISPIRDEKDNDYGSIYVFRDITEKKKREEEIIYLSFHDKLTGLHNRAFFEVELQRLDTKRQYPLTVMMGDCNGLKITNDIFGHQEGDNLLIRIAVIFKKATRKEDIVARWGGDEFAVILPQTPVQVAEKIRDRILKECAQASDSPVKPSISLGIASKSETEQSIVDVLKEAEDSMYRQKLMEDKSNRSSIIASLVKTVIKKSRETKDHADRIQALSSRIALEMGLSETELDDLRLLSVLHDMGKIAVPDMILQKPGRLSPEEWEQMKKHSEKGCGMAESSRDLAAISRYILYHHEHWDGSGYPEGLKEEAIPLLSRIVSIVDAYDVMTHASPYKKALSHEEAMHEIRRCAGTQFDPRLVDIFIKIMDGYREEVLGTSP